MPTSISPKGQLTIPTNLRKRLNIEAGDQFEVDYNYEIEAIVVYPLSGKEKRGVRSWKEDLRQLQKLTTAVKGSLVESLLEDRRDEIRNDEKSAEKNHNSDK